MCVAPAFALLFALALLEESSSASTLCAFRRGSSSSEFPPSEVLNSKSIIRLIIGVEGIVVEGEEAFLCGDLIDNPVSFDISRLGL